MKRKAEKLLMMAGGIWNIVAAALTIFGYSGWFREEGTKVLSHVDKADYANTSLLDNLVQVAMIYGLFVLIITGRIFLYALIKVIKSMGINFE